MFAQINSIIIQFFVKQIILWLEFLNSSFLLHCDIKPENILLNYNFTTKISDFSLIKQIKKNEKIKLSHGTFCFESPEYFTQNKEINGKDAEKIDIFALEIIIYYMLYKKCKITKLDKDNNKLDYNYVISKILEQIKEIEKDKNSKKINKDLADLIIIQFFVRQIILGIEFINSSYLVHCDIKPENILLNFNFNIKITDFSLVKPFQKDKKLKLNHGTFCVEGPEYYTENKEIDGKDAEKIDIFSLGIIICFMLYKEYKIKKIDKETNKLNYNFVETKLKELIKKIENDKEHGKLNTDLADLIISMIKPNISERASLNDILTNEWINTNNNEIERIHNINDGEILLKMQLNWKW